MDAIYVNGNILTMDEENPRVESVYTKYDRICGVGSTDEVRNMAGTRAEVIDLGGNTMLPGFVDTHNHMCMYALLTDQADCRAAAGCVTRSDVIDSIKAMADKTPKGQWIMGWGYAPYLLQDKSDLTREDLDLAGTDHPICLVHISVHGCVVNSLGLKELGFSRETPDPPGGKILRGANGEPNGILQESAFMGPLFFVKPSIYSKIISGYSEEGKAEMMARCIGAYHKLGLVGVHDPFVDAATLRIYQDVVGPHGSPFRLDAYILNYQADPLMEIGIRGGFGSSWLKVGHVKVFLDGGMSSRTAAVHEPYANGGTGITNYDQDAIDREIAKFDRAGYSISIHAQGDRGIGMALDAFRTDHGRGQSPSPSYRSCGQHHPGADRPGQGDEPLHHEPGELLVASGRRIYRSVRTRTGPGALSFQHHPEQGDQIFPVIGLPRGGPGPADRSQGRNPSEDG